ncbi:hypothetical protein B566_EDAN011769 [Ephemera danica]|nr:hypothetical protein B566_EDAN011769 [Ephemera danica]
MPPQNPPVQPQELNSEKKTSSVKQTEPLASIQEQDKSPETSVSEVHAVSEAGPQPKSAHRRDHGKSDALPPPKPGYFHTAPARPHRHVRAHKSAAPASNVLATDKPTEQQHPDSANPVVSGKDEEEPIEEGVPRVPIRRHNSLRCDPLVAAPSDDVPPPSADELIYQWFDASEAAVPTAPPRHARPKPPMKKSTNKSPSLSPSSSSSSFEDAIAAAEAIYSERIKKQFPTDSTSSISSASSSTNRKSGGFLSFLRWLRRGGSDTTSEEKVNELSRAGSTNSLGTVVSAASSFAYIGPNAFHAAQNRASLHYAASPVESETYRYRLKQRENARKLDKNLTLKRKYKLKQFACSQETVFTDTLKAPPAKSVVSTGSGRRSRKRPAPPIPILKSAHYTDCSLPATLVHKNPTMEAVDDVSVKMHRRTNSESSKDKRAGAYCHVKGKRKAPQPPPNHVRPMSGLATKFKNPFPSFGRKKRQAPPPPDNISETSTKLSNEEKQRLISNINKLRVHAAGKNDNKNAFNANNGLQGPALIASPPIVLSCTSETKENVEPISGMKAPLSPKPWFKRNSTKASKAEKKAKKDEEEMPEVSYARVPVVPSPDEGKRKSLQLSMLASISELDREAAEIVQNQHKRAAEMIAARNNSFYLPPPAESSTPVPDLSNNIEPSPESPAPRAQTKSLISMFNAITNVSKVTVNTSTAAIAGFFNGETRKNRISQTFSVVEEQDEEDSSSASIDIKITQVQTSSTSSHNGVAVGTKANEISKPNSSPVKKDTASDNKPSTSSQNGTSNDDKEETNQLYPKLPPIETTRENQNEPPLPLSIAGIPEGVTLTRQKRVVWSCPRCTLENPRWRLTCDACDMWRPSSLHEETAPAFVTNDNVHAVSAESKDQEAKKETVDIDELKPPEPIGPIDWESELKRYFEPNNKVPKSPEPPKKVSPLMTSKVEEAIKILEGKQAAFEYQKPGPSKVYKPNKTETPKVKEPEYAAANKKSSPVKSPEPQSPTKVNVEKPMEKKLVTPVTASTSGIAKVENKKVDEKPVVNGAVKNEPVKVPDNFIGGRTKADEQKATKVVSDNKTKVAAVAETKQAGKIEEVKPADIDEVRKARLAFFNKPPEATEDTAAPVTPTTMITAAVTTSALPPASPRLSRARQSVGVPDIPSSPRLVRTAETATDTKELLQNYAVPNVAGADKQEKMKLREKLKEMKNSLPKFDEPAYPQQTEVKPQPVANEVSQGAIKKTTKHATPGKSEPGYENIKGRIMNKPVKVSTSVQTSGVISARKLKVEEPPATDTSSVNIKNGKLYTSLSKSPSFRGTGTFELIGANDFATIEATKGQNKKTTPPALQHVYANVPSPGLVQEASAEQTKNGPVPQPSSSQPAVQPNVEATVPNRVVVKVETNTPPEPEEEEEEDVLLDDQSSASGAASVAGSIGDSSDIEKLAGLLTRPKGLAEFKADLAASPQQQQCNTLAVNRLLRRLEAAIANGQHRIAAGLARDLARLKVSCSVIRQRKNVIEPELFTVDMYVEDKVSHQGPIPLSVCASMTVGELKVKVQQEFEIPAAVQRWILGKQLASDDSKTLQQHSVAATGCTVFLYLVAPPERTDSSSPATEPSAPVMTPTPAEESRMVPTNTKDTPHGPGWYYNFEEDRYSYCGSSDDEEEELSEPEEVKPLPEKLVVKPTAAPTATNPPAAAPVIQLPPEEESESSDEEEEEEEEEENEVEVARGLTPSAPPGTLTPEKKTGTLILGWRCVVCTLINPPTRPGCAACTTERPADYKVPINYEASDDEAHRLRREEEVEKVNKFIISDQVIIIIIAT